jgi:hypothetical protein
MRQVASTRVGHDVGKFPWVTMLENITQLSTQVIKEIVLLRQFGQIKQARANVWQNFITS